MPASSVHAQCTTFELLVEASLFRMTGWFHIHLFFYLYREIHYRELRPASNALHVENG